MKVAHRTGGNPVLGPVVGLVDRAFVATGIQTMTCTLFDNDTRYLHTSEFDTDSDPYIDDSVPTEKQRAKYAAWMQHIEEAGDSGTDNLPTANDIKVLLPRTG